MELITFHCNACQQVLKVSADNAGKQAKCPRCGAALVIPHTSAPESAPQPAPPPIKPYGEDEGYGNRGEEPRGRPRRSRQEEDEYDDDRRGRRRREDDYDDDRRDRPRRRDDRREDEADYDRGRRPGGSPRAKWKLVRAALLIVFISTCVAAGALALELIGMLILTIGSFSMTGPGQAFLTLIKIGRILATIAGLGALVGYGFGLVAPAKNGALGLIIATLAVGAIHFILAIIFGLLPLFKGESGFLGAGGTAGRAILELFIGLLGFAELILMGLFLRSVALTFKSYRVAGSCLGFVIFAGCAAGYSTIWPLLMRAFTPTTAAGAKAFLIFFWLLYWIGAFLMIGILIWYILLLWRARDTIDA